MPNEQQTQAHNHTGQPRLEAGQDYEIVHHPQAGQWEVRLVDPQAVNGEDHVGQVIGYAAYDLLDDAIAITATVVNSAYRGHGIAGELMSHALDDIRAQGLKVLPLCSYAAAYIDSHPEYHDLKANS